MFGEGSEVRRYFYFFLKVCFTANLKRFPEKTTQPRTVRGDRGSKVLSDGFHLLKSFERSLKISM